MTIKEKLETLLYYYINTHGSGHSTLLKEGTDNYKNEKLILAFKKVDHKFLNVKDSEIISWIGMQPQNFAGHNKPLVIDNGAMYCLLLETLNEINILEQLNETMKRKYEK